MSALNVKCGKGFLKLRKSASLVGLKTNPSSTTSRGLETTPPKQEYIEKEHFKDLGGFNVVSLNTRGETVDRMLDDVRGRAEIDMGTHVYYAEGSDKPLVATGEVYITFEDEVSEEEQDIALDEYKLALVRRINDYEIVTRVTEHSPNPIKTAHFLNQISMVKEAEPDLDMPMDHYAFQRPVDQLVNHQWHIENKGFLTDTMHRLRRGADAKVMGAWKLLNGYGSNRVTIAVIDTGFDLSHPDLNNKVVRPFDIWNQSTSILQGDARYTHGTPCASVALAAANGNGIVGAAPNARFMPISGTTFSTARTEQMFDYCVRNGADIISCSWGTTDPQFQLNFNKERAIAKAAKEGRNGKGCIILFAAGNEDFDYLNYYAAHPDVIAVGASTSQDARAFYSNRGRELSILAPSNGDWPIIAARAWWDQGYSNQSGQFKFWRDGRSRGDRYKHFGGTSSATPLVAGICALMLSANPNLTAREVKEILQQTADKIGSSNDYYFGHSARYGYGRVNAEKAVEEALRRSKHLSTPTPTPSPGTSTNATGTNGGLFKVDVEKQPATGWGVQIGAYTDYNNVIAQSDRMKRMFGQPVIVSTSQVSGRMVYKVLVGNYPTLDQARRLQTDMKSKGINGFPRKLSDL